MSQRTSAATSTTFLFVVIGDIRVGGFVGPGAPSGVLRGDPPPSDLDGPHRESAGTGDVGQH